MLKRVRASGADEATVLDGVHFGLWSVTDTGIVFVKPDVQHDELHFYDVHDRSRRSLGRLPVRISRVGGYGGLRASRDGRWVLFSVTDQMESDIMVADGFRRGVPSPRPAGIALDPQSSQDRDVSLDFEQAAGLLAEVGGRFDARNWVLGTSGNFSVVLGRDPLRLAMTRSGVAKGSLDLEAIVEIDGDATVLRPAGARPSAEALLHVEIARSRGAEAVLHTHSIWSTILSDRHASAGGLGIAGYEMLKGLEGVSTHEHEEWIPILENDQDMTRLAGRLRQVLAEHAACHAFLLRRHGMYTWGETLSQAVRHVEIVEFLLEAVGRTEVKESPSWQS